MVRQQITRFSRALGLVVLSASAGCATFGPLRVPGVRLTETRVPLHGHALTLRLSAPKASASSGPVLLLYATGDAGWFGKDRAIFGEIARWGYPAAGFSAREYVHHLGASTVRPVEIADDFRQIIAVAESALALPPGTRVVLVGKSRGAGLDVAAAGPPVLKPLLDGIIAVGLTKEEEYVHRRLRRSRQLVMLQTYSYLPQLGSLPIAVIQSTHDQYVPAGEARQLFGPNTPTRELVPIESPDHNFDGALDELYGEMARAFRWILSR
jgi:fermentation-respiration switch protein FrsA (DUF1100 family)